MQNLVILSTSLTIRAPIKKRAVNINSKEPF